MAGHPATTQIRTRVHIGPYHHISLQLGCCAIQVELDYIPRGSVLDDSLVHPNNANNDVLKV